MRRVKGVMKLDGLAQIWMTLSTISLELLTMTVY